MRRAPGMGERWQERRRSRAVRRTVRTLVPPPRDQFAGFGESFIVPPARVENPQFITIGDGVIVHEHVWFSVVSHFREIAEPSLVIEDDVRIGRGCQFSVAGQVTIERGAIVSDFVQVGDTFHPYDVEDRMPALTPPVAVRICRGAVIGSHAVVLPGVTIGPGALVDHRSVVVRDVPAGTVVGGNPARPRQADAKGHRRR